MAAKLDFEERQLLNGLMEEHAGGDLEDFGFAVWEAATKAAVAKFKSTNIPNAAQG
jgi:hypothetical protein